MVCGGWGKEMRNSPRSTSSSRAWIAMSCRASIIAAASKQPAAGRVPAATQSGGGGGVGVDDVVAEVDVGAATLRPLVVDLDDHHVVDGHDAGQTGEVEGDATADRHRGAAHAAAAAGGRHRDAIVVGEEEKLGIHSTLDSGLNVGTGQGPSLDVVLDPIDGTELLAIGHSDAISVIGVAILIGVLIGQWILFYRRDYRKLAYVLVLNTNYIYKNTVSLVKFYFTVNSG